MEIIVITKLEDADKVKFGDQVDIEGYVKYPDPPTDSDEETFDERFAEAKAREVKVLERVNKAVENNSEETKRLNTNE